jgi:hypothetical protein
MSYHDTDEGLTRVCPLTDLAPSIEAELIERYQSLHASLAFFRIYRSIERAWCYVARQLDHPPEILVFQRNGRRINVLNEMIHLGKQELQRFADCIFANFPDVDLIRFKALCTDESGLNFPVQKYRSKDTFAVSLPTSPDEYLASIGKTTRASIRHQLNTIKKTFPSFQVLCQVKDEVDPQTLRLIMKLSEQRINSQGNRFSHDADRIISLAKECGFVIQLIVDGRMCAGSINYQVGAGIFGDVTCYDPEFKRFGAGKLCTYLTICESIRKGARTFYLGGGEFEFKERMLGKRLCMDELQIHRSRFTVLRNLDATLRTAVLGNLREYKSLLHQRKDSLSAKIVFKALQIYKNRIAK